jgi:flagellar M-ring protein FliF
MLLVVRPLVRRVITPDEAALNGGLIAAGAGGMDIAVPAGQGEGESQVVIESDAPLSIPSNKTAKMIDIAQVRGQVHAQSVQKVGELADRNPNETVSIIRTWLHDPAS